MSTTDLELIEESWDLMEVSGDPPQHSMITRRAERRYAGRPILFAVDANRQRHMLIPVRRDYEVRPDTTSAGVRVGRHELIEDARVRCFVDVACLKPHLNEHFSVIAAEILEELESPQRRPDISARSVLDRWRELLESSPSEIPSAATLTGVFGELVVLEELARLSTEAAAWWCGPDGARHDFVSPLGAIEVKTTRSRTRRQAKVHGPEQLAPPECGHLYLAFVRLEKQPSKGKSIPEMVGDLVSMGVSDTAVRAGLLKMGIGSVQMERVEDLRFVVRERTNYLVGNDFPRIIPASFESGTVPPGVLDLEYQIDLSGEAPRALTEAEWNEVLNQVAGITP